MILVLLAVTGIGAATGTDWLTIIAGVATIVAGLLADPEEDS